MKYRKYILLITVFGAALLTPIGLSGQDWESVMSLRGEWKFSIGDRQTWAEPDYNDSDWEKIRVPSTWEDEGFHGYDGYAWYRTSFNGRELSAQENYYLRLGYIDDVDEVYVNGNLVGITGSFPPHFRTAYKSAREYPIPTEFLNFDGRNVIAVRIYDTRLEGGIVSGRVGIYINRSTSRLDIDLSGIWKFSLGDDPDWKEEEYNDSRWERIKVPSSWDKQGFYKYDGYAWYRKEFFVPKDLEGEDLVLFLGRIDDFDRTYINGKLVGSTKDFKRYGTSMSFREKREYKIPSDVIKPGEMNTIAVRVEDMGNVGGIYEGTIGIVAESRLTRYWRR